MGKESKLGAAFLGFAALACGEVKRESSEIHLQLHGTAVVSGGHEAGGCGAPWVQGNAVFMMEPAKKFDAKYRSWTDGEGRAQLTDITSGCTLEVESPEVIKARDAPCIIAEGSALTAWGFYERIYSYMEVDLGNGTFRASERSRFIDNNGESQESCSVAEGRVVKL